MRLPLAALLATLTCLGSIAACSSTDETPKTTNSGAAAATIGSEGGTLTTKGVELVIPAGALAEARTISIAATTDGPPAGIVGYSQILRFEPEGLVFKVPVSVKIAYVGAPGDATLYWTKDGSSAEFENVGGSAGLEEVSGSVTHFSRGFVGRGPRRDGGSEPSDASTTDASSVPCTTDVQCSSPSRCCGPTTGGVCVDTSNNPSHCGSCGHACAAGEACSNSQCIQAGTCLAAGQNCADGLLCCSGACVAGKCSFAP